MKNQFEDKNILITGGSGSIGRIITHEILKFSPSVIRIFDLDEMGLFQVRREFKDYSNIRYLLGDVRDKQRLNKAVEGIDLVYHTASLKHVFSCEYNPFEAVKTNVLGVQNLCEVAIDEQVEKVIFTSSDKAVNPSNVMGVTKLLAEKLIIAANYYKGRRKTAFSCVRFGNVVGSRGSVVSIFMEQISKGGPVTITDPKMTRYIITMQEAIDLLFNATEIALGGEIFVSKMKALKIIDLAKAMIQEYSPKFGYSPDEINININGKAPGEKLYEELLTSSEVEHALEMERMFIILPEIREFIKIDETRYTNAKPLKEGDYRSLQGPHLTKQEIRSILNKLELNQFTHK